MGVLKEPSIPETHALKKNNSGFLVGNALYPHMGVVRKEEAFLYKDLMSGYDLGWVIKLYVTN